MVDRKQFELLVLCALLGLPAPLLAQRGAGGLPIGTG
jgi:hypothetical protein